MKTFSITLFAAAIIVIAILAPSFMDRVSETNTKSKSQSTPALASAAEKASAIARRDSFSVGNALGKARLSSADMRAEVDKGKNFLLTQLDNRLAQLGTFANKVNNATALSDPERKVLVSELNAEIDRFKTFKSEVSGSMTKEDVKNIADKIKAEWIKSRYSVQRAQSLMTASKERQMASDADETSLGIQKRIDVLKAAGKNANAHEELLAAYDQKMASAQQDIASANAKLDAASGASSENEKQALMKQKDLLLSSASDSIKAAYKLVGQEARREFSQRFK